MKKLTKKWQILLYGCAGIGINMLNILVGSYLCSALLTGGFKEHVESWTYLNKDLVVAGLWSIMIVVAKIVDGIIDIPMSSFTDNLKTKRGRRRPAILIGVIPMFIFYCLFLVPLNGSATILNTIWFAVLLCGFYTFYTLTMVTYYATFAEIVDNEKDRLFLSNTKSICDVVYFSMSYALVPVFVNGGINIRIVALCAIPLALTMLIPFFMIKENPNNEDCGEIKAEAKGVSLIESFSVSFQNKAFVYWLFVVFVMNIGLQLFLSGINEFFSTTGISMVAVMASSFAPVPITILLYNKIIKKKGLRTGFQYVMIVFSVAMLAMLIGLPKTSKALAGKTLSGLEANKNYAITVNVEASEEEKKSGAENYTVTSTFTSDENGNIDLTSEKPYADSDLTFADYAENKEVTISKKESWITPFAILCGVIASFAIGAFFSITYTVPANLAAEANERTGKCASSMFFAVQGLFEGVSAGIASGVILVAIKQYNKAQWITVIVAVFCMLACFMACFLPKSMAKMGKIEADNK